MNAAKSIDDASGITLKAGPSGRYVEIKVDSNGRASSAGRSIYLFNLQLRMKGLLSSKLVQDSLKLVSGAGNSLLPSDPLLMLPMSVGLNGGQP
jgi:hypothetical protein